MKKFSDGFLHEVKKEIEYEKEQKRLKKEHAIAEEHVVVVEKKSLILNLTKFFVRSGGQVIKVVCTVCILILAVVGLAALIFPESRRFLINSLLGNKLLVPMAYLR